MRKRIVFSTRDVAHARDLIAIAYAAGFTDDDLSVVARSDIELEQVADQLKMADSDFIPAALRGAGYGAITGTLAGLVAVSLTPLGITLAGAALAGGLGGGAIGAWVSSLVGSSIPDPIRQEFEDEIKAGRVLVAIYGEPETLDVAMPRFNEAGAVKLDYERQAGMT
jgi:hypothetical protein